MALAVPTASPDSLTRATNMPPGRSNATNSLHAASGSGPSSPTTDRCVSAPAALSAMISYPVGIGAVSRDAVSSQIMYSAGRRGVACMPGKKQPPAIFGRGLLQLTSESPVHRAHRFGLLSRNGRLVAVVETTVMSPRAVTEYTRPLTNETPVRVNSAVFEPGARAVRSYTAPGMATNALAPL